MAESRFVLIVRNYCFESQVRMLVAMISNRKKRCVRRAFENLYFCRVLRWFLSSEILRMARGMLAARFLRTQQQADWGAHRFAYCNDMVFVGRFMNWFKI